MKKWCDYKQDIVSTLTPPPECMWCNICYQKRQNYRNKMPISAISNCEVTDNAHENPELMED